MSSVRGGGIRGTKDDYPRINNPLVKDENKKSLTAPQRLVAAQLQDQKWDFNRRWMMKEEWLKQITAAARRLDL